MTVLQNRTNETDVIRILGLIKNEINCFSKIRLDLMSVSLPSIWIEIKQERSNPILVAGFYREWSHEKNKSTNEQVLRMEKFCGQMKLGHTPQN